MLLRRFFLTALLACLPAVALCHQMAVATTAKPVQAVTLVSPDRLAQIELPPAGITGSQTIFTSLGWLDYPSVSIADGYYRINQLEKFKIVLVKLDRYTDELLLSIAGTDVQAAEALVAQFLPQRQQSVLSDRGYYWFVVRWLLDQNRVDEAAKLVTTKMAHTDISSSSDVFKNLVAAYLRQNRLREALETIKQFSALQDRWLATKQRVSRDDEWFDENYQNLIAYYLTKQQYQKAFEVSQHLQPSNYARGGKEFKPPNNQIRVLLKIAATCSNSCSNEGRQVRSQALKRAEGLAAQFKDVNRVEHLAAVAMGYSKTGQKAKADQVFTQALQLVPKITSQYPENVAWIQAGAIAKIASYQAGAGNLTQALKLTNQLEKGDKNRQALLLGIANLYARQGNQKRFAELYNRVIQEGDRETPGAVAKSYLAINRDQQAIQFIRRIQDPKYKRWELMELSKFYQDKGNRTQALTFLNEAVALFPEKLDPNRDGQEYLLREMLETVDTYRELKDLSGAEQLLDRVHSLANQASQTLPDKYADTTDVQSAALYKVVSAYAQIGQVTKSLEIVPTIRDWKVQDRAKLQVVNGYLGVKNPVKALELARSIQQSKIRATALTDIAHYFIRNQQPEKALPLLDEAFNLIQTTQ